MKSESPPLPAAGDMAMLIDDPVFAALDQGVVLFDDKLCVLAASARANALLFEPAKIAAHPGMTLDDLAISLVKSDLAIVPENLTAQDQAVVIAEAVRRCMRNVRFTRRSLPALRLTTRALEDGRRVLSIAEQPAGVEEELSAVEQSAYAQMQEAADVLEEGFALHDADFNFVLANRKYAKLAFGDADFMPERGQSAYELLLRAARTSAASARPPGMSIEEYATQYFELAMSYAKDVRLEMSDGTVILYSVHPTRSGGCLFTILDITEREAAAAEVEQQRAIAHQNEKLSALGELLAGVAHELNNPLSIVTGYAQMLAAAPGDEKSARRIEKIRKAAERSARIVKTFLAMARQRPAQIEQSDPAELIETAAEIAAYGLRSSGGTVTIGYPASLPQVSVDKDQLVQVIANLIVNAEQAMKGMGDRARMRLEARERGRWVEIAVSDNGEGMDADTQVRIFEPFFTTKDVGEGTGFGLAFCHKIVTSHEGRLTVHSASGEGSRFVISLPAITGPTASQDDVETDATRTALDILVVDDERDVAELVAELLGAEGHRVKAVFAPIDAIRAATAQRFDIVISDMKMPGMMGDRLLERLVEVQPTLGGRIGFITGDSLSRRVADFLEAERHPFIEKPIGPDELRDLVQRLAPECGDPT